MDLHFLASLILLLLGLFFVNSKIAAGQVGVCLGGKGNNLPSPVETVALLRLKNIRRIRTYSADHDVLNALRGSGIEVMLGLPNPQLQEVATSQANAENWVRTNVYNYRDVVNFRYVSVGNEVKDNPYAQFLVPAMRNIDRALSTFGLGRIKVSTALFMGMLEESYPPSKGLFRRDLKDLIEPIIRFLVEKQSPLHFNLYPYFSYSDNPQEIGLDYALFKAPQGTVPDGQNSYQHLFDAMLDSVYWALEKSGGGSLDIVVSETGWPTAGGRDTNVENARVYNNNLINHLKKRNGTPKKPGKEIETYIFAMYDENEKTTPPEVERFWGLFYPNKTSKYDVNFG